VVETVTVCLLPHSLVIGEDCLYTSTVKNAGSIKPSKALAGQIITCQY
jgi:hypothetical protein